MSSSSLLLKDLITYGKNEMCSRVYLLITQPAVRQSLLQQKKTIKTYNRRDSQMVTHSSTSRPVQCLCMAERTGCPVFTDLWSYVLFCTNFILIYAIIEEDMNREP
jgi:hypothetical protein